ncbi:MAG: IS607 family transposase, partial [Endozoicomonas sp.]|uniref:IS607 family transposase n=1 Tax=Endozoicomonas sp. TaxID=1892382 RepID=UPI003D9AC137
WESTGELLPARKTKGGTRYYDVAELMGFSNEAAPTLCYCRVSSHDQKADLDRQQELLEAYCSAKGWRTQVIRDLGSGMNYRKKGLNQLLELVMKRQIKRLVLSHKDRLLRFGAELVFSLCDIQGIEIVIIHKGDQPSFEEELANDVLEIITVFSARLYGSRSKKHKKMLETLKDVAGTQD